LKIGWYFPKFRNAVKAGLKATNWDNLVMDDADRYHTALWIDYNFQGKSFEERKAWMIKLHEGKPEPVMIAYRKE
jgi:hypothetical protein